VATTPALAAALHTGQQRLKPSSFTLRLAASPKRSPDTNRFLKLHHYLKFLSKKEDRKAKAVIPPSLKSSVR
jgi:hypothetical protein